MPSNTLVLPLTAELNDNYLQTHGNIDRLTDQYAKTYQYIRRSAHPIGFVVHEKLVLKLYQMLRETEPLPQHLQETLHDFIYQEIEQGRVAEKQGMGFAILSQGFLSINIWGRGNVLFTQTYTVEGSFPDLSPKPLEKTGVACTWEIKIMQYEYMLWHDYLETTMSLEDKKDYLQHFITGDLF
ncbi:hypothetical protein [Beggiatoa leptomitoformis]|uniref:Uncharacterized protein n=1 Tax=Beggiatoa leptomitoformis TaxID=288004 RepID=A0A2N9YFD8_9GAMM|nr:hypothetical protein [Beggiatoa leptomitoformis]ALG68491.1 hypothetical protein AL038_13265 [Beggiatoa leptomitoformis]AUI69173.1 hypothetical protein BLE401_11000 [Beggiatoa leptomitoformis]